MDEFDHRRQPVVPGASVAQGARGEQQQGRAQALAARCNQVLRHLRHQRHACVQAVVNQAVNCLHVAGNDRKGRGGRGAQELSLKQWR